MYQPAWHCSGRGRDFALRLLRLQGTDHCVQEYIDNASCCLRRVGKDVERISHRDTSDDLIRSGLDIGRRVLARAVRAHPEDRVFMNGPKKIVFPRLISAVLKLSQSNAAGKPAVIRNLPTGCLRVSKPCPLSPVPMVSAKSVISL